MMAYVWGNPKTKKQLKDWLASGRKPKVFQPGPFGMDPPDGICFLEGPQYPEPHRWYAKAEVKDCRLIKILK